MSRFAFLFGLAVIAILIFSLYRAKQGAQETIQETKQIEARIDAQRTRNTALQAELAHRSRQEWIEEYARRELGMQPARSTQFVDLQEIDSHLSLRPALVAPEEPSAQDGQNE